MQHAKLIDKYNRNLTYLRVSVTDRCNLRCMYCMPPREHIPMLKHKDVLRYEEMLRIIRLGVKLGITKVRVTGGEPLVRKGIYDFLKELGNIKELIDISLTTNAVLLKENLTRIKDAGIRRLNISLDTLHPEKYEKITGKDCFERTWRGIMAAHEAGFSPIKLNTVVLNGVNDDELIDLAKLSLSYPFHIRFIEYMPIGADHLDDKRRLLAPDIFKRLSELGELKPVQNVKSDGPAERYRYKDAVGEIGIIRPLSHHFCHKCNRLRLTASGALRPCLLSDRQEDLIKAIRSGCLDDEIIRIFLKAVEFKPMEHHVDDVDAEKVKERMASIGG